MSKINCNNCAVSDFKESLCHRCSEMKRLGRAEDIEGLLIKAFSEADSPAKSDCISRDAAIDAVNEWLKLYAINRTMSNVTSIQDILRQLPSAQPEIVRCKECIYHAGWDYCEEVDGLWYDDDFCCHGEKGERRDEG